MSKAAMQIPADQHKLVATLLRDYLPGVLVWAYGSRVTGQTRPSSDLDLVAFAAPDQVDRVAQLDEAFAESDLPFRVDLLVWDELPERFQDNIEQRHTLLQPEELGAECGFKNSANRVIYVI